MTRHHPGETCPRETCPRESGERGAGSGERDPGASHGNSEAALNALARHFSATWEEGENPSGAYITIAGKGIAIQVAPIRERATDRRNLTKPRLRFDRVADRLVQHLRAALSESVPGGTMVIVTITAPIRLPSKTAAALEDKIQIYLARESAPMNTRDTIHGNQIGVRFVNHGLAQAAKVIGFVHNPDTDSNILLDMAQSFLDTLEAEAGSPAAAGSAGDRWLVLTAERGFPHVDTYRHVYSQLSISTFFKKILLVLADGRVETITG